MKPKKIYSFSSYDTKQQAQKVFYYIKTANDLSKKHNIEFYCLLIPARDLVNGSTLFDDHYDLLCHFMNKHKVPFIDLRNAWHKYPGDRTDLYYKLDNHWNDQGIQIATSSIYDKIKSNFLYEN